MRQVQSADSVAVLTIELLSLFSKRQLRRANLGTVPNGDRALFKRAACQELARPDFIGLRLIESGAQRRLALIGLRQQGGPIGIHADHEFRMATLDPVARCGRLEIEFLCGSKPRTYLIGQDTLMAHERCFALCQASCQLGALAAGICYPFLQDAFDVLRARDGADRWPLLRSFQRPLTVECREPPFR